ncbi:MAG: hypothetical protein ABI479_11395 [Gallionella sp.]
MTASRLTKLVLCAALCACSSVKDPIGQDPLQNTKKLAAEGHATLYNNGAFEVPMTTIHIIPPGPGAFDLASEMAGMRARQSFQESIKHARESVDVAGAGISKSMAAAAAVNEGTNTVAGMARDVTRFGGRTVGASPEVAAGMIGASVSYSKEAFGKTQEVGENIAGGSLEAGSKLSNGTEQLSAKLFTSSKELAKSTSKDSKAAAQRHASYASEHFVQGYAAVPEKLGQRANAIGESASLSNFVDAMQRTNQWRAEKSGKLTDLMSETTGNYSSDIGKSLNAAKQEITEGSKESGYTLAMLKSLRWVVQGIFWDATIKPVGKLTGASLGYITVNAIAFPTLLVEREGVVVVNVAVQVAWNSAASVYDVTAPSATSAVAGLFSAIELVGGQVLAGGELLGGTVTAAGAYGAGKTAAAATAGGGYVVGKTVQYVGAPISSIGVAVGGSATGVFAGTLTAAAGGGMMVAGVAGEGITQVAGKATSATMVVGGSAVSVATGAALGTYELAKAVVVPTGYELGSGIVLSYGTLSQLSAQTVLAVSDASYMVLSLEGPRWVLYAVKGNVDNGDNLPTGALLDLKAMQQSGETFYAVPASNEEMDHLVNAVPGQLPVEATVTATPSSP